MSDVYLCKGCGQLIESERNRICPVCGMDLTGNVLKEKCQETKNQPKSFLNYNFFDLFNVSGKLVIIFLSFVMILWMVILFGFFLLNKSLPDKNNTSLETKSSIIYKYFANSSDVKVSDKLKNIMHFFKKDDPLTFVLEEYPNGDVWLREGENHADILFIPMEKVTLKDNDYNYYVSINMLNKPSLLLPNSTNDLEYGHYITEDNYQDLKNAGQNAIKEKALLGKDMEGIFIAGYDSDFCFFLDFSFHYEFDKYKEIKTKKGIVYELSDGRVVSNFLDIPHTIVFSQDTTFEITELTSKRQ